jgi:site-specific recombinase XerD
LKERGINLKTSDPNVPCFVNSKGKRLSSRTIQRQVTKYIKQVAEGTSLGPHSLRHSFATHMINHIKNDQTIDIRSLQELLGHSSLSSTQIYTQIQQEKMKKIYKKAHPHGE